MLDEYVLVPDIFDPTAYSNPAFIEMCLPHLKEPLLQEALVRDLCDGGWAKYCMENSGNLHRLCKEIVRKLEQNNRLRKQPRAGAVYPNVANDWCSEGISTANAAPLSGIIAGHVTKQGAAFSAQQQVASIERLTAAPWWQARSSSVILDRKTADYRRLLERVFLQARSLMFIDPNLDPSASNYREFEQLFSAQLQRTPKPVIEIHRSFCKGDGPARTFPTPQDWEAAFAPLERVLRDIGLTAEVFGWDDFHGRYLISDVIGLQVEAGFDTTRKMGEMTAWVRIGRADKDTWQREYDPASRPGSLKWRFTIG